MGSLKETVVWGRRALKAAPGTFATTLGAESPAGSGTGDGNGVEQRRAGVAERGRAPAHPAAQKLVPSPRKMPLCASQLHCFSDLPAFTDGKLRQRMSRGTTAAGKPQNQSKAPQRRNQICPGGGSGAEAATTDP